MYNEKEKVKLMQIKFFPSLSLFRLIRKVIELNFNYFLLSTIIKSKERNEFDFVDSVNQTVSHHVE